MIQKIHPPGRRLLAVLICGISAVSALAQEPPPNPAPGAPGPLITPPPLLPPAASSPPPPTAQTHHRQAPPSPLFDALDTNHDGVISAEEIANAPQSLKALLKNGSDHLTRDDFRPPAPPARADKLGNPAADEAGQPRPKIGAIRPHGPPVRDEEEMAAEPAGHRMHRPSADDEQASEDFDRPHLRHEEMDERRHSFQMERDEMDDARPYSRHERMSEHRRPARDEEDEMDDAPRPHRPDPMRDEREARPRPEDAARQGHAQPRAGEPANDQARPLSSQHGPPPMPLFDALDTNHDGVISAEEIADAPAILKGLLKNGSDHLTRDDLRPTSPPPAGR